MQKNADPKDEPKMLKPALGAGFKLFTLRTGRVAKNDYNMLEINYLIFLLYQLLYHFKELTKLYTSRYILTKIGY